MLILFIEGMCIMKTTVSKSDFRDAFQTMGRGDNFSYDGLGALYDFIEQLDDDCGNESELDVIAYCCEFTEYGDLDEFRSNYEGSFPDTCPNCGEGVIEEGGWDCPDCEESMSDYPDMDAVTEKTMVIRIDDDAFIIQDF